LLILKEKYEYVAPSHGTVLEAGGRREEKGHYSLVVSVSSISMSLKSNIFCKAVVQNI